MPPASPSSTSASAFQSTNMMQPYSPAPTSPTSASTQPQSPSNNEARVVARAPARTVLLEEGLEDPALEILVRPTNRVTKDQLTLHTAQASIATGRFTK